MREHYFRGAATEELMIAGRDWKLLELFKKYGLPHRKFAHGHTALTVAYDVEKCGFNGTVKRAKCLARSSSLSIWNMRFSRTNSTLFTKHSTKKVTAHTRKRRHTMSMATN